MKMLITFEALANMARKEAFIGGVQEWEGYFAA